MGHMLSWWKAPIPPSSIRSVNPLNFAIAQIILTVPIVIAGYRFYTVGFKNIWHRSPNMDP
jgi:Cu+-exporting ATPase